MEYALNRLLHPLLDSGQPVRVSFADGVYQDVRLQIIRQGRDTSTIYLTQPSVDGRPPSTARPGATCNDLGGNCRVVAADFTFGADTATPLLLAAEHDGQAVFDGTGTRDASPMIDSQALTIAGSIFGASGSHPFTARSARIANVAVQGLVFRNYRNGLLIRYATHVLVSRCRVEGIGDRTPRATTEASYGTFGLRVDDGSELVLVRDTVLDDVWNVPGSTALADGAADPGLIHAVYDGYSRDVVFLSNTLSVSSGPSIKWGFYPITSGDVTWQYPAGPAARRSLFIGNQVTLAAQAVGSAQAVSQPAGQAFIHDNSREAGAGGDSPPAAGIVFLSNRFVSTEAGTAGLPVSLLRQELPAAGDLPSFPGWAFHGNTVSGVAQSALVTARVRSASTDAAGFEQGAAKETVAASLGLAAQAAAGPTVSTDCTDTLDMLMSTTLKSRDPERDRRLLWVATQGDMPVSE